MTTIRSHSAVETEAFGERIGRAALPGWVIGLSGDLGSGKTTLVRGLGRGLGFFGRVHSPTFALMNEYEGGRTPLFHLDLYRLNTADEIRAAGLEEYLVEPPGVSVVEWVERWEPSRDKFERCVGWVRIWLRGIEENTREIRYETSVLLP